MTRDVNPGIEGIMQHLVLSPDNRYAAAFTTNNQVIVVQCRLTFYLLLLFFTNFCFEIRDFFLNRASY